MRVGPSSLSPVPIPGIAADRKTFHRPHLDRLPTGGPVDERQNWRPVNVDFTTFMYERIRCPACSMAQTAAGAFRRVYVRREGDFLLIARADTFDQNASYVIARQVLGASDQIMYQILGQPPKAFARVNFWPGAGAVFLSWHRRGWRLKILGGPLASSCHADDVLIVSEFAK